MEITNGQISTVLKKIKNCVFRKIKCIIYAYFILLFVFLFLFCAKTVFYPLKNEEDQQVLEYEKINSAALDEIARELNTRDKTFSEVEALDFQNPFD